MRPILDEPRENSATELRLIRGATVISRAYDRSPPIGLERIAPSGSGGTPTPPARAADGGDRPRRGYRVRTRPRTWTETSSPAESSRSTVERETNDAPSPRFTASLMAALLPISSEIVIASSDDPARSSPFFKAQRVPEPGSRMMSGSRASTVERDALSARQGMARGQDEDERIGPDGLGFEARLLGLLPHQAERRQALHDLLR